MLRKTLSFVASLFAVVLLAASQTPSNAQGTVSTNSNAYIDAYSYNSATGSYTYTWASGYNYGGTASGTISVYDYATGQSYGGWITSIHFDGTKGHITSIGYLNGYLLTTAEFDTNQLPGSYFAVGSTLQNQIWDLVAPYVAPYYLHNASSTMMLDSKVQNGAAGYTYFY